ncbi:MAG TPA: protein kinase [Acidimicrobiales bacterium]|nr:protein kinase [Acidimicrobiales bacterium]
MPDPIPLLSERVLLGRYAMVRPIARGGMAEVWEGYDEMLARPVAVKVLHPHLAADEGFVERFRREAVAAAKLAHPGIVATFDTGSDGDVAFIVMELVRGRTLRQAIEEAGSLPPSMAVTIAAEVADALDHAHRAGLVHRDIKPANILLPDPDGSTGPLLRVKVADFGIAKLQSAPGIGNLTQTGAIVGTAKYLSPEQVQGHPPDARSDEYALGVMLYEMLCGRPPYVADTELATALQHVRGKLLAPSRLDPAIPRNLEAVVMRAMAREPDDRYPSVASFRTALLSLDLLEATGLIHAPGMAGDGAVPDIVRDPTPPAGLALPGLSREHRVAPAAFVAALVVIALLATAVLLRAGGDNPPTQKSRGGGGGPELSISAAHSFDPQGRDGEENESEVPRAHDGNAQTGWRSDRYKSRAFGGLKAGVGLALQLEHPQQIDQLIVRSTSSQWSAAVYAAGEPGKSLEDWGLPVDTETGIDGDGTFDLGGRKAGAVLLWITDPGSARRIEVAELILK